MNTILNIQNYFFNYHALPWFISGVLIVAESVFVFLQNRRSLLNISFAGIALFCGIWLTGVGFTFSSVNAETALIWGKYVDWLGIIFITPFVYLFSTALVGSPSKNQIRFSFINFIIAFGFYLLTISTDKIISGLWEYPWGFYPKYGVFEALFVGWFYFLVILSFCNFIKDFKKATSTFDKNRIKLVIIAFIFGFVGSIDFLANFGVPLYTIGSVALFIYTSMIAYTIVNYKFMDIETVLHKTMLWILSFAIIFVPILFMYKLMFNFISQSEVLQTLFAVVIFIIFAVYMRVIQPKVDHYFQRRRSNLEDISSKFVGDLVLLEGLDDLVKKLEETIEGALYAKWVDVFIFNESTHTYTIINRKTSGCRISYFDQSNRFLMWLKENDKIAHRDFVAIDPQYATVKDVAEAYFKETEAMVVIPLVLGDRLLGVINLDKKANLARYNAVDFAFLTTVKNQSAIAISNSLIYENIEEQVKQRTKELVEVQKQLTQAEKLATVGTLSGGVAHEINNPLTAILTNVQMCLAFAEKDAAEISVDRESLELMEEATQRCREIVQKLMTYARKPLEDGKAAVTDVSKVLNKVVTFLKYQLEQDSIQVVYNVDARDYCVLANPNELEQVFTNLIINARDAMIEAKRIGNITISLSKSDTHVIINIKDEGAGMAEDTVSKIFDPFFTTKDVGRGLGLGLSICQSIVEKYEGEITVESKLNEGTVFSINFLEYLDK